MLRDEAFYFTRIGTFIERADSTARILTAHQNDLRPGADASVVPDPYQWSVLLRALSAFEVYRRVYRDVITPYKVAQLLILRDDMPRSLTRCCKEVYHNLESVSERSIPGNRAARGRNPRHAAFHANGSHHRGRIAAIFCSNFSPACAIWVIASPPTSWCRRRRLKRMQLHIRHETRYRYERPVKYSVQSLHLTPRRDRESAIAVLDHHRARTPARADRRPRQYLASAHHRAAAPGNPDRGARRGGDRRYRERARTTGRSRRSPISRPPRSPPPNDEIKVFARKALEHVKEPRERAQALAEAVYRAVRYKHEHQRRAGHRPRRRSRAAKAFARITPTCSLPRRARSEFRRAM